MKEKKWCMCVIILYFTLLFVIGVLVVFWDPYFHYHAPCTGVSYVLEKKEYINDGISRHFDYNAMITGTSMTRGFKVEEAEELFSKEFVRITYLGEGFKKINDNLKSAIAANPDLELVIRGMDPIWFITDENWLGYSEYPDYLYDDILWNDVNYLYNKDIFWGDVVPEIIRTTKGEPSKQFDDYVEDDKNFSGKVNVLEAYERSQKENKVVEQSETDEFFRMMNANIESNVISTIKDNSDISFYIFIPPYSILWWDELNQHGTEVLERRIDMEEVTIENLLQYENVRLFSFSNNFDLTCDLNNYTDEVHYTNDVSSQILKWMAEGKYELTNENYEEYIKELKEFYCNYDYDAIFR